LLAEPQARRVVEQTFERVRQWYGFYVCGHVIMPEHIHLLISEPDRATLSRVLQMFKQNTAHLLRPPEGSPLWLPRYCDFNVWSEDKRVEKLRYMHRNPVKRGLVERPEDWLWSSFRHYATGVDGPVGIESQWTARKRELLQAELGSSGQSQSQSQNQSQSPHPVAKSATRMGHPPL
jgi:putative transposase